MITVAFIQSGLAHYRVPFYRLLQERLRKESIELLVVVGSDYAGHNISGEMKGTIKLPVITFKNFCWMSVVGELKDVNLVVVPQVLKQLWIYPFFLRHFRGTQRVALWGHGKLFSGGRGGRCEAFLKRVISKHCHWWFAYTESSAKVVREEIGFPEERITIINNAIDVRALAEHVVSDAQKAALRTELKITSPNVGIFVGGMYHTRILTKRLRFLIDSCLEIKKSLPDFEMIFVGGGPDQRVVESAAASYDWIHYVGVKKGIHAIPYWSLAKVNLNPGLVGLGILDSQILGVPLVTSDVPYHSPEIDYLKSGINGLSVADQDQPRLYADAVVALLANEDLRQSMVREGKRSAAQFTNEAMVENVAAGILAALALPIRTSQSA